MANGAIVCKNPPVYPMMNKLQAAEAAVPPSPINKLCRQAPEPAIPELGRDCGPKPLRKGGCVPFPIECGPFPGPNRRLPLPTPPIVGPFPMPPGTELPGGCFPGKPVNIRDEIRKSIQICPSRGPNGEAVWPTGEQIDKMVDDILKHKLGGGGAHGVRGRHSDCHARPMPAHGCKGGLVEIGHGEAHAVGQTLQGHGVSRAQKAHSSEAHARKLGEALSSEAHARPTGRGGAEPMGEPLHARPLDGAMHRLPAPKGNEYYFHQQQKMMDSMNEFAKPLNK